MMEETLLDNDPSKTYRRGTFLSVLCILVWIGCTVVIGVNSLIFIELSGRESYYPEYDNRINTFAWSALIFVGMGLLSVAGSILMWLRRRMGFYLYLPAQLISLVLLGYVLLLDDAFRYMRAAELLVVCAFFAIPVCFIVLFALQLKRMRQPSEAAH